MVCSTGLEKLICPLRELLESHRKSIEATLEEMHRRATAQVSMQLDVLHQQQLDSLVQAIQDHQSNPSKATSTERGLPFSLEGQGRSTQCPTSLSSFLPPFGFSFREDPSTEIAKAAAKAFQSHEERLRSLHQAHANRLEQILANARQIGGGHELSSLQNIPDCKAVAFPEESPVPEALARLPRPAPPQVADFGPWTEGLLPASAVPSDSSEGHCPSAPVRCRPSVGTESERHRASASEAGSEALQAEPDRKEEHGIRAAARAARTRTPFLDKMAGLLICLNMIFMAVEVHDGIFSMIMPAEDGTALVRNGQPRPTWSRWLGLAFALLFTMEIAARFALERWQFMLGPERYWNLADSALLLLQWLDIALNLINPGAFKIIRAFRAIVAVKVMRSVRLVRPLRVMVASMSCSLMSLLWAMAFLAIILFLAALALQQSVQTYIEGLKEDVVVDKQLMKNYGTLHMAMISLFKAISGGADWEDLVAPLENISPLLLYIFVTFICVLLIGVMNILTALFVESTCKIASTDKDLVILESIETEEAHFMQLRAFLASMDTDHSGTVTKAEFDAKLADSRFRAELKLLGLEVPGAQGVFTLTDSAQTGEVDIDELTRGLMRLKGAAKAMDVATLLHENSHIVSEMNTLIDAVDASARFSMHTPNTPDASSRRRRLFSSRSSNRLTGADSLHVGALKVLCN